MRYMLSCLVCCVLMLAGCQMAPAPAPAPSTPGAEAETPTEEAAGEAASSEEVTTTEEMSPTEEMTSTEAMTETEEITTSEGATATGGSVGALVFGLDGMVQAGAVSEPFLTAANDEISVARLAPDMAVIVGSDSQGLMLEIESAPITIDELETEWDSTGLTIEIAGDPSIIDELETEWVSTLWDAVAAEVAIAISPESMLQSFATTDNNQISVIRLGPNRMALVGPDNPEDLIVIVEGEDVDVMAKGLVDIGKKVYDTLKGALSTLGGALGGGGGSSTQNCTGTVSTGPITIIAGQGAGPIKVEISASGKCPQP